MTMPVSPPAASASSSTAGSQKRRKREGRGRVAPARGDPLDERGFLADILWRSSSTVLTHAGCNSGPHGGAEERQHQREIITQRSRSVHAAPPQRAPVATNGQMRRRI